jgi:hypothetical protein
LPGRQEVTGSIPVFSTKIFGCLENNPYICIDKNNYHFSLSKGGEKISKKFEKKKNVV